MLSVNSVKGYDTDCILEAYAYIYIPQALDMCSDQNTGKVMILTVCLKHIFWHHFALIKCFSQAQDICSGLNAGKVSILT